MDLDKKIRRMFNRSEIFKLDGMGFKKILASFLFFSILAGCAGVSNPAKALSPGEPSKRMELSESVKIQMSVQHWGFEYLNDITTTTLRVQQGESFEPEEFKDYRISGFLSREGKFFLLAEIQDNAHAEIVFDEEELVIRGESIDDPTTQNPVTISTKEEVCFRTRTVDGGSDICLSLME